MVFLLWESSSLESSFSPCIEQVNETIKKLKENNFINIRMYECLYRTFAYARTQTIEIPILDKKRKFGEKINFEKKDVLIAKNKTDMRGHTGFLLFGIYKENDIN